MTRRQLTDEQGEFIEPYLPIGEYGPYPAVSGRLSASTEAVISGLGAALGAGVRAFVYGGELLVLVLVLSRLAVRMAGLGRSGRELRRGPGSRGVPDRPS